MDSKQAREEILNAIRAGLKSAKFKSFEELNITSKDLYHTPNKPVYDIFADELSTINGETYYFPDQKSMTEKLNEIHNSENLELCYAPDQKWSDVLKGVNFKYTNKFDEPDKIRSGISSCEYLIARFGSVLVSSALPGGRRIFSFPEIHIVIATENQLIMELEDGIEAIVKKYGDNLPSQIINISGPSRTADIEKTLILGAHGPKKLIVFVLKS